MKRIAARFALMMAVAAMLPLLAYGAASVYSVRDGAQQAVIQGNQSVADQVAEQIELYVRSSLKILDAVSAELRQTGLAPWQQDRVLKNFVLEFPEFTELTRLDGKGHPIVSSRIGTPTTEIPGPDSVTIGDTLLSRFVVDDDLLPTAVAAVRLGDGSDGWLLASLNLEELWRMVDRIKVGKSGYALVVGNNGQLIAHGNPREKSRVARGENLTDNPVVATVRTPPRDKAPAKDGGASRQYTMNGVRMLGVAAEIPSLGWTVVVEQPIAEAFRIAIRLQQQLAIAIALALCAMLIIGYVWGHSFIDPILRLTRGTQAIAAGQMDVRVDVRSEDELGQLGVGFNNMADRLVELQEDVRKKERQAMFGRMSIGLVHDLSHPIQNIGNHCKLLVKVFDDLEYREVFKRNVERDLAQVKRVLDDLRNVARPTPIERFPLDINRALADLVESMQATASDAGLTIQSAFAFGPIYVMGDLFALNRVHRNLIVNALQATSPGGTVMVRTMRDEGFAVVEVADTGCGIPPERVDTIFDDFVTTKRRGLGLGLAISKKIVEQLDGRITVASATGVGSTFTMRFPLTSARPAAAAAS